MTLLRFSTDEFRDAGGVFFGPFFVRADSDLHVTGGILVLESFFVAALIIVMMNFKNVIELIS